MDLQKLVELLTQLEDFVKNAPETNIKEENKAFVYAEISNLKENPTPEQMKIFMETLGDYLYIQSDAPVEPTPTPDQVATPVTLTTNPPSDLQIASQEEDRKRIEAILASLRALNNKQDEPV